MRMKKRVLLLCILTLSVGAAYGCGQKTDNSGQAQSADTESAGEETVDQNAEEETVGLANPWSEISEAEAKTKCERLFRAPEGAVEQVWMKCEALGDPAKDIGPVVQLSFVLDGMNYTARAQQGADEDTDIAGNYFAWTTGPEDVTLANWGGGSMTGHFCRNVNDNGFVDQLTWYDTDLKIVYSLSAAGIDPERSDIKAVAEQMYQV